MPKINKEININLIAIVADLIEIPKLLNVMQFNSNEGACLQCFFQPQKIVQGKKSFFQSFISIFFNYLNIIFKNNKKIKKGFFLILKLQLMLKIKVIQTLGKRYQMRIMKNSK